MDTYGHYKHIIQSSSRRPENHAYDEATFQWIDTYHTDHDNEEAQKKAGEYLQASMYMRLASFLGPFVAVNFGPPLADSLDSLVGWRCAVLRAGA